MVMKRSISPDLAEKLAATANRVPKSASASALLSSVAVRCFAEGGSSADVRSFLRYHGASRVGLDALISSKTAFNRHIRSARAYALSSFSGSAADEAVVHVARFAVGLILSPVATMENPKWVMAMAQGRAADSSVSGSTAAHLDGSAAENEPAQSSSTGGSEYSHEPQLIPVLSPAAQIKMRYAMAHLVRLAIRSIREDERATFLLGQDELATLLGCTRASAAKVIRDLVEQGWIKQLGMRKAARNRYEIGTSTVTGHQKKNRLNRTQKDTADSHFDTIGIWAGVRDEPNTAADLLRSVTSPAWVYGTSPLGARTWVAALAMASGVDPLELGVTTRSLTGVRKCLTSLGLSQEALTSCEPLELATALSRHAAATGAREERAQAAAKRKAAAEARASEREVFLAEKRTQKKPQRTAAKSPERSSASTIGQSPSKAGIQSPVAPAPDKERVTVNLPDGITDPGKVLAQRYGPEGWTVTGYSDDGRKAYLTRGASAA